MVALKSGKQQINQIRRSSSIPQTPDSVITQRKGADASPRNCWLEPPFVNIARIVGRSVASLEDEPGLAMAQHVEHPKLALQGRGEVQFDGSAGSNAVSAHIAIIDRGAVIGIAKAVLDVSVLVSNKAKSLP